MTEIEAARAAAAERYPEALTDSQGREHANIPRRAILSGAWDAGRLVQEVLTGAKG